MMSKKMLIDASRSDETRVVVMVDGRIEEIDHETADRRPIKSNIYLARVTRVEPSLQAAFVDYGGNRHGFLPFSEIHPDYYQLPVADREALLREVEDKVEERRQRFLNHRANPRRGGRGRGGRSNETAAAVDPEGDQPHVDFPVDQNGDFIAPEAMTADNLQVGGDDAAVADAADVTDAADAAPVEAAAGAEAEVDDATVSLTEAVDDGVTEKADNGDADGDSNDDGDEPAKTATAATGTEDDKVVSDDAVTLGEAARDLPQGDDEEDSSHDDIASEQLEAEAKADNNDSDDHGVDGEGGIEELPERDLVIEEAGAGGAGEDEDNDESDEVDASEEADASAEGDDDEDDDGGQKPRSRRRRRSRRGRKGGSGDEASAEGGKSARSRSDRDEDDDEDENEDDNDEDDEDMFDEDAERRSIMHSIISRRYSIQEVIKRRQVMLVQVTKEERGNKGAALSSYLSLAGRYSVYMPNTTRGGGISRKISSPKDRRRLKTILDDLDLPQDISIIVRTAGSQRTKAEIKRDYEYLRRTWDGIRETTLNSMAPSLIYEEANVMKRAIRDMYSSDMEEVLVEGDEGYKDAKSFMKTLTPSHAKRVQPFKNEGTSLFQRYKAEQQLDALFNPVVTLKSGGYLVLNQTEALVAVDVNSGKATRERSIEETALATNLEAAEEVARQLRLRDLAGLVVIDFIDMDESRHRGQVERRLKESMRGDRARIQLGRISPFGLLELSRQRIRPSVFDTTMVGCPICGGIGVVRSSGSLASSIMRRIGDLLLERDNLDRIEIDAPTDAALKVLNDHREELAHLETQHGVKIAVLPNAHLHSPHFHLRVYTEDKVETFEEGYTADPTAPKKDRRRGRRGGRSEDRDKDRSRDDDEGGSRRGRRGRGRGSRGESEDDGDSRTSDDIEDRTDGEDGDGEGGSRRQRGKRGGRRRGKRDGDGEAGASSDTGSDDSGNESDRPEAEAGEEGDKPKRRRGKRGGRNRRKSRSDDEAGDTQDAVNEASDAVAEPAENAEETATEDAPAADTESDAEDKPKPRKRTRSKAKAEAEPDADAGAADSDVAAEAAPSEATEEEEKPKKRTRAPRKSAAKSDATSDAKSEDKAEEMADAKDEPAADTMADASDDEGGSARSAALAVEPDTPKKEGPRRRGWWSRGK
jgi:ribonuclease E